MRGEGALLVVRKSEYSHYSHFLLGYKTAVFFNQKCTVFNIS